MNNLETLKQELLSQKELIEKRGGIVVVAGSNPSPSEITQGIKTIQGSDMSLATATEDDVRIGKTFYAGDPYLKTGTANMDTDSLHHVFMYNIYEQTCENRVYYTCPDYLKEIRVSKFEGNYNPITFIFNNNLISINESGFSNTRNFIFQGFSEMTQLEYIGQYAFRNSSCEGIDFSNMPNSIETIQASAFENTVKDNQSIKLPESLKTTGDSIFKCSTRKLLNNLDISNVQLKTLPNSMCYYLGFNCDLVVPETFTMVASQFNFNGCFRNIVIKGNTQLYSYSFYAMATLANSMFFLQSVVLESETPPAIGGNVFAEQNITNGFKIYVPDNSLEAYKALTNLAKYTNCIYPMSQKE